MKAVLIDACVLYPTVLREIVTGCAGAGLFRPLWSARILDEWFHAVRRNIPDGADVARAEIAALRDRHPDAAVPPDPALEAELALPDRDDRHVLAAAIRGGADVLLTQNIRDFPLRAMGATGIERRTPDGFLCELHDGAPGPVRDVVARVHATARRLSGEDLALRPLLRRARLPRLGGILAGGAG